MTPPLLPAGAGPDPAWLAARRAWWRAREAGFRAHAPVDVEPEGLVLSAEEHAQASSFLPLELLVHDVERALRAWFGEALWALDVDLRATDLGAWRSWLDARARQPWVRRHELPSDLLGALAAPGAAQELLLALATPPRHGAALGRYELCAVVQAAPAREALRAWDVGCATGEGTWELAVALAARAGRVEALGTTPCALQRLAAERRPGAGAALEAFVAAAPRERLQVWFARHDVLGASSPPGRFDVIACHGLLGEGIDAPEDVAAVVARLAEALAPDGVLSVQDRFREDRAARARALVERAARAAGLRPLGGGLFAR